MRFMDRGGGASRHAYDVNLIVTKAVAIEAGALWHFAEIAAHLGRPRISGSDPALQAARRILAAEHGIELQNVRREGYRVATDRQIIEALPKDAAGIRKRAKRSRQRAANVVDFDALPDQLKIAHNAHAGLMGVIELVTGARTVRRVEAAVSPDAVAADPQAVLDLIRTRPRLQQGARPSGPGPAKE